jgi:hypothetical protein
MRRRLAGADRCEVVDRAVVHRVLVIHVGVAWRPGSPEMNTTAPL